MGDKPFQAILGKANQPTFMKLIALIVLASITATELHMSYSLARLEKVQDKANVEFQQIRADW